MVHRSDDGTLQCEWCFCDNLGGEIARVVMMQYSKYLSLPECREELINEMEKGNDRPLQLKIPPGISTTAKRFETCRGAIEYLRQLEERVSTAETIVAKKDTVILELHQAEQVARAVLEQAQANSKQAEQDMLAAKEKLHSCGNAVTTTDGLPQCEWCYCDILEEETGRVVMVKYNQCLCLPDCRDALKKEMKDKGNRPLQLKVPPATPAKRFETYQGAIDYLTQVEELVHKATGAERMVAESEKVFMESRQAEEVAVATLEKAKSRLAAAKEELEIAKQLAEDQVATRTFSSFDAEDIPDGAVVRHWSIDSSQIFADHFSVEEVIESTMGPQTSGAGASEVVTSSEAPALWQQLGTRGPLDPLLYLRAQAQVDVSSVATQPLSWQLSLPRDFLRKARESLIKRPRRGIASLLSQVQPWSSADVVGDLQNRTDGRCVDLLEDDNLHERWAAVLAGRQVDLVPKDELRWLVDSGTPLKHRHRLWRRWWAGPALAEVENLAALAGEEPCTQIERDVDRTLPQCLDSEARKSLRRVLRASAALFPEIGYCQGMSFVTALPLLLGFDEASTLACLRYIIQDICPEYHGHDLKGFFLDIAVLRTLVHCLLPEIGWHLEAFDVSLHMLATDHLLTLTLRTWPLQAAVRLWDLILMEGSSALLASFLVTLEMYLPAVMESSPEVQIADMQVDISCRFKEMTRCSVAHDIDEIVHRTRKFIPLVRGDQGDGTKNSAGAFLTWLRADLGRCLDLKEEDEDPVIQMQARARKEDMLASEECSSLPELPNSEATAVTLTDGDVALPALR